MIIKRITIDSFSAQNETPGLGMNILQSMLGLESPTRRVPTFNLPHNDGIFISNSLYGERVITLKIQLKGSSQADYLNKRRQMFGAFDFQTRTDKTMNIIDIENNNYYIDGRCISINEDNDDGKRTFNSFTIQFLCDDPAIYSSSYITTSIYLAAITGGLSIPTSIPLTIGTPTGLGYAVINNTGNYKSYPILRLYGPLTNPRITNNTTGKAIQVNTTLTGSDEVIINTKDKTIVDQAGNNLIGDLDGTYNDFFALAPGNNQIQLTHTGSYSASAYLNVQFYPAYIGI